MVGDVRGRELRGLAADLWRIKAGGARLPAGGLCPRLGKKKVFASKFLLALIDTSPLFK
jgi:hypothetical protein